MDWNLNASTEWDWENLAKNLPFSAQESSSNVDFSCFSASADSSSKETIKAFGVFDDLPKDFLENGSLEEANSVVSGEALIGLKLMGNSFSSSNNSNHNNSNNNNYNNNNNNNNNNNSDSNKIAMTTLFPTKRSRASYYSSQSPRCQVEGCNLDLASAKDYHRRHRICATHSKSPKVIVAGMERRFCQQCSRFHDLSEFDDRKRSCRRRLSAHNARRRRPQSEDIHFSSTRMSSPSLSEGRPHMNYLLNRRSMPVDTGLGESSCNSFKGKECLLGLADGGGIDGLPAKGAFSFGSERFAARNTNHNGMDQTSTSVLPGDVKTAFSLLSTTTTSWSSSWPVQPSSFDHHLPLATTTTLPHPRTPSSDLQNATTPNAHLQDFRSFRLPHEFERFHFN